ncbi:MAG: hypothetical protein QF473_08995, partial [Planctomycetota bacterium]|nr:hypothetical protein [Planctomycetota bacterium]
EDTSHPDWLSWIRFQRDSFEEYVTAYCDAVHSHKPGVLVCSNWMQTFKNPGEPKVPTDWISGDNTWVFGLDGSRCEARFISTRGKPWDIMLWSFYRSGNMRDPASPWCVKPVQMLQQEAAVTLALGGNLQIYENPGKVRDGRLASWRMKRLGQVGDFVRARQSLCQGSETIPQVAILHSETHFYSQSVGNLRNGHDALPVEGAVFSLLENSFGVDILDEWALLPKLQEFPMVVVPEQHNLSDRAVRKLKEYVKQGGRLLVTGAMTYERFGARFLGARSVRVEEGSFYHVAAGAGAFPFFSENWRLLKTSAARELRQLMPHDLLDGEVCPHPAAVLNKIGKGSVAYVPADLFRYFRVNRYPFAREFIGELAAELSPKLKVRVEAPPCVDAILRQKDGKTIIHLINRLSGIPNQPGNGAVDEIPPAGPVKVVMKVSRRPRKVSVAFERGDPTWQCRPIRRGSRSVTLTAVVKEVHIHSALVVE